MRETAAGRPPECSGVSPDEGEHGLDLTEMEFSSAGIVRRYELHRLALMSHGGTGFRCTHECFAHVAHTAHTCHTYRTHEAGTLYMHRSPIHTCSCFFLLFCV